MIFPGYLNVYSFQSALLAAREADAITLQLYAYFWIKDFPIFTDIVPLIGATQLNFVWYLHSIFLINVTITG